MLFRDIKSLGVGNLNKECVKSRLQDTHQLNRFLRFLRKIFHKRRLKHLITLLKIKI